MVFSNLMAFFIILTAAAVLNAQGKTSIQTAAQAVEALRPVAGPFASAPFAVGIIGTGLLALPVLAGSAGYALGEVGLERRPCQARGFYGIIAVATLLGLTLAGPLAHWPDQGALVVCHRHEVLKTTRTKVANFAS